MDTRAGDPIAEERAALRRVAVLVARGAPPEEVFAALTAEVGRLLDADLTAMVRYDADRTITYVARWSAAGDYRGDDLRRPLEGRNVSTLVYQTRRPARIDDFSQSWGWTADTVRRLGIRSSVGAPVFVEGRLWGVMNVSSTSNEAFPADTEERLAGFTELAGAAIANAQARVELRGYADEEAALRRVATLVASGASPEEVFAAVAAEAGRLLGTDLTGVGRYDESGAVTVVGAWRSTGAAMPFAVGTRTSLGGKNLATMVFRTGRPVRIDDYGQATGVTGEVGLALGYRAAVGAPVTVGGRLWGVMSVGSTGEGVLPANTEERLAGFTELAGTAIANAEAQAALAASRARIVTAADEARRRIERDLHDGAQQRLVTLGLRLRELQATASPAESGLAGRLDDVAAELTAALEELREIARGIHPAVLADGGLRPALRALAHRSAVPVNLQVQVAGRVPDPVEIAAYYVVCEALVNTARHAHATAADVEVTAGEDVLRVSVRDDGCGGAAFGHGSGLVGLRDRVEALGGRILMDSPPGKGTTVEAHIPVQQGLPGRAATARSGK
jgi:signal transduction histidine kinase